MRILVQNRKFSDLSVRLVNLSLWPNQTFMRLKLCYFVVNAVRKLGHTDQESEYIYSLAVSRSKDYLDNISLVVAETQRVVYQLISIV